MHIKVNQITEDSWLILSNIDPDYIKLLSKNGDAYVLTGNNQLLQFDTMEEVDNFFDVSIFSDIAENVITKTNCEYYIRGYYIDCDNPVEVPSPTNGLPLYRKYLYSNVEYAAGYYAIERGRWTYMLCPKLSTLHNNRYEGPFRTKTEAVNYIGELRKRGEL